MSRDETQAFDRKEAARRLGLSVVTIDREVARGNIPHFRIGRRVLFIDSHIREYIHRNEIRPKTQDSRRG